MTNKTIKLINPLGITLYKRERINIKTVEYHTTEKFDASSLGLYILAIHPKLKFDNHTLFEEVDWLDLLQKTLLLTLTSKLLNKEVDLYHYNDKEYYLFGLFTRKIENYFLKPKQLKTPKYSFEKNINQCILYCHKEYKQKNNLNKFIKEFLNIYLGTGELNKGAKKFWKQNLKNYSIENDEFTLKNEDAFLGLSKKFDIEIDSKELDEIIEKSIRINNAFFKTNSDKTFNTVTFKIKLYNFIQNDIDRRKPKNDND